ncbi:uncharacterized protein B0J16DRAFT_398904 [Fusarium flagelliforme]|uniref:uncharacterized protein n=1 Tax=Fusarium flagelliforme TaxID=2675880 RepID=UPI001E8DCD14|nr:uncharacterized protein B0J16DRAFT_398904 [Fusarium flagelliforme]KAH7185175.1 hypothetical protein B0J16DRAFT_398904 [Fusarium flagelliforme]
MSRSQPRKKKGNKSAKAAQPQVESGTKRQLSLTDFGFSTITNKKHQQDRNIANDEIGGLLTETAPDTTINGDSVDGLLAEQQEKLLSLVVNNEDSTANLEDDAIAAAIPEGTFIIDANGWSRVGGQPVKAHAHDVRSIPLSMVQIWVKRTVKDGHRVKDKFLPTNDPAILALHETEIIERLNTSFVRSPSNDDYLMYRCDYTGQLLSWTNGPRNASLEAVCAFASSDGKVGYHVLPNIGVVMYGLNVIKRRHSPIVLPLISTWLHALKVTDFPTRKKQLVWAYTAISNESMMGYLLGYFGIGKKKFLQFEASDEATRMDIVESQRTGALTNLLRAKLVGSHPRDFGGANNWPRHYLPQGEKQRWASVYENMKKIGALYGLTADEFQQYATIPSPNGEPVFYPYYILSAQQAQDCQ